MITRPIKIGLVGLGKMGMLHLEKLHRHPRVEVSGVFDVDNHKLKSAEKSLGIKTFSDLEDLFFDSDAVVIASPTPTHFSISQRALNHELHVFLEKPICHTASEGLELVKLAAKQKRILQLGFLERYRWMAVEREMPGIWASRPQHIFAERSSSIPSRDPHADIVTDLMVHDVDFVVWAMGEKPMSLQAEGLALRGESLDLAYARLEFQSGAAAHLKAQWVAPERKRETQIFWERSSLSFDLLSQKVRKALFLNNGQCETSELILEGPDSLTDQLEAFVSAVEGKKPVVVSGQDGCFALEVCEAIKNSILSGRKIELMSPARKAESSGSSEGEYVN